MADTPRARDTATHKASHPPAEHAPAHTTVRFESTGEETTQFVVMDVRSFRKEGDPLRVVWDVPSDLVERFSRHFFVVNGRIKRA
jgi:hypothetical protein